jgi:hypothetical protein
MAENFNDCRDFSPTHDKAPPLPRNSTLCPANGSGAFFILSDLAGGQSLEPASHPRIAVTIRRLCPMSDAGV